MSSSDYLGEIPVPRDFPNVPTSPDGWAVRFIEQYGQIDGSHHKQWILDQVARVLMGTPVVACVAQWGTLESPRLQELRFYTGEPSAKYLEWVRKMRGTDSMGDCAYDYDEGVAP